MKPATRNTQRGTSGKSAPPSKQPVETFRPSTRDALQSRVLVWMVAPLLFGNTLLILTVGTVFVPPYRDPRVLIPLAISVGFSLLVWRLRAATWFAAVCGGMITLAILWLPTTFLDRAARSPLSSGLSPLMGLFLLTFASTRAGRRQKSAAGLAESRRGRDSAQVIANLGVAALLASPLGRLVVQALWPGQQDDTRAVVLLSVVILAALVEATADTVSSEIGQAFGGQPILITSLRRVDRGTDGAITLLGTSAGVLGAGAVALIGGIAMQLSGLQATVALAAGVAGLFFDSLLGATIERRGWLGNDLVNFTSTSFASAFALLVLWLIPSLT